MSIHTLGSYSLTRDMAVPVTCSSEEVYTTLEFSRLHRCLPECRENIYTLVHANKNNSLSVCKLVRVGASGSRLVDFDLIVSPSAGFCLGSRKSGRIGIAPWQHDGIPK